MTWWQALILGIVEGITEYLPVSSTGHLILVSSLLGFDAASKGAVDTFNIVIQAGAILAVLGLYRQRVAQMATGVIGRDPAGRRLAINLVIAFLPAAVLGPLLVHKIKTHLFEMWPVVAALFAGAWLMLAVARSNRLNPPRDGGRTIESMEWQTALLIGFCQCIAMWPGMSRSMMTIVAALMLGLRAKDAAEFSFLLGLLTLGGATAYEVFKDGATMFHDIGAVNLTIGLVAATVSAAWAIRWMVAFLTRHGMGPFGWYRLALAGVMAVLAYFELVKV